MSRLRYDRPHALVCGSRNYANQHVVRKVLRALLEPTTVVVSGGCRGVDQWAADAWRGRALIEVYPDWDNLGKAAGPIRNAWMLDLLPKDGVVVAFWDGKSRGTRGTMVAAEARGLRVLRYDDFGDLVA